MRQTLGLLTKDELSIINKLTGRNIEEDKHFYQSGLPTLSDTFKTKARQFVATDADYEKLLSYYKELKSEQDQRVVAKVGRGKEGEATGLEGEALDSYYSFYMVQGNKEKEQKITKV